jgi:hypothetical protein
MTFSLLNPALLAFAALIAVPVLAHLFAKARPREQPFPSLQWLRQVERRTASVRKPRDWLLLLLRTLAIAALVASFLQPLLFSGASLTAANARKTLVLVMDRSASMNYVEQGQSRLARAASAAGDVLKSAGSQTLANVVWLDARPAAEFPDPSVNVEALRDSLRRTKSTIEPGDVSEAMRLAMDQLGRGEGAKELYLISDFQSSAWKSATLSIPPNVKLLTIPVPQSEAVNAALTSLTVQPERPVSGSDARVLCRVRNFSGAEQRTTVQLAFAEVRQSRALTLHAWGEGVAEFRVPSGAPGLHGIAASLPEDAFPADDRRFATLEVRENWRVHAEGAAKDPGFQLWQRALAALGWLNGAGATADQADVLLAVQSPPERASALSQAAERGATVICQPGEDWNGSAWMAFWDAAAQQASLQMEIRNRSSDKPWTMQTTSDQHPLWQLFLNGEYGDPAAGNLWQRLKLSTEADTHLIRYADGVPALAAKRAGKGWLILWNIPLDERVSDCVQQSSFLVLLGELLLHHSQSSAVGEVPRQFLPPQNLFWRPQQPVAEDQVRLQDDSGTEHPLTQDATQSPPLFRARETLPPGNYRWLVDAQPAERASLNFPADAESDLRTLDPATLAAGSAISLSAAAALAAQRDGLPLWPWCLGFVLIILLLESLVARSAIQVATP